jgi:hypothetical protein
VETRFAGDEAASQRQGNDAWVSDHDALRSIDEILPPIPLRSPSLFPVLWYLATRQHGSQRSIAYAAGYDVHKFESCRARHDFN